MASKKKKIKGLDKWGVRYFSVREFVDLLDWNYIVGGTEWRDTYHLWRFAECTGDIVVGSGVVGIEYTCNAGDSGSDTKKEELRSHTVHQSLEEAAQRHRCCAIICGKG